MLPKKETSRTN